MQTCKFNSTLSVSLPDLVLLHYHSAAPLQGFVMDMLSLRWSPDTLILERPRSTFATSDINFCSCLGWKGVQHSVHSNMHAGFDHAREAPGVDLLVGFIGTLDVRNLVVLFGELIHEGFQLLHAPGLAS